MLHCFPDAGFLVPGGLDAGGYGTPIDMAAIEAQDREEFERQMQARDWGGVEHRLVHVSGDPATRILEASTKADLVVLGTHGRTGLASAVLGSVAYGVLRKSEKPVAAIRLPGREFQI